jgi:hypothetical protein
MSDNIKRQLNRSSCGVNQIIDEENNTEDYVNFNTKNAGLKARLFQKNPELVGKVLDNAEKCDVESDIYSLLGVSKSIGDNNMSEFENINTMRVSNFANIKRARPTPIRYNKNINEESSKYESEDEDLKKALELSLKET